MLRLLRVAFVFVLLLLALMSIIGASAPGANQSAEAAVQIATVLLMVITPFLGLAHLHLDGPKMVLASMLLAFAVGVVAQLYTGELKVEDLQGGVGPLFLEVGKLWAIQQAVFQLFKDSKSVGPLLTAKPLLAAPANPPGV